MHLEGVLFFPVTPFGGDGRLAEEMLARHVDQGVTKGAGGVFAACGTGEFHALDADEYERVVRVAVETTAGRVPVLSGAGGSLPYARECARRAAAAGADGLLVMPPYLVSAPPEGVARYVRELAAATDLPLIVYLRGNARLTPDAAAGLAGLPNVVGFKDGIGDIDLFQRILLAVRRATDRELLFINGLPTAEMTAHAYRGLGVPLYSSAVYGFLPEVALAFYRALTGGDDKLAQRLLTEFYRPLVELRDQVPGYAVALIKAGVTLRGIDAGSVRPPLVDPTPEHIARLERLIAKGLEIAGC
ncbi:putative 5-dehydro-4-deoxyglucarate dehydratase [Thermobispora bispora]|jgi:5-dehydro-4-deoxyglucarate dehydratase|uniref:Probable 5-dehydro-4-deoxyglucarate dehydratase n=1 Tax=Thermobispora bispora (strain ATCC 19993 / DSM 43833 / CBS 139.67 / JCM 10125 / KCTC 9307 / NBRC 14880 / R51) TaxID=469371 RepID=D6Y7Y7_THEBD|nr:5-dehydro-4-deoxyglucarate dehydratase [Thermobispora bispora]ADG87806.1 dihydrodipicolinate synthetase [Thermobispora bispora DSM 43833]MBO2473691.1 5-dehydro-4-deoxyglucarate dehydratase [Actinomycetales bacterium]MBX6168121.1 5-dehydro-4-deoxyglucarate dehydratase [Thermobispora bispora]QSI47704.1 5-dehydro-4-deoxyglucarate dehydratase [Thermobispora bispora]